MKFHQESDLIIQICKMVIFLGGVFVIDNYDYCQSPSQTFMTPMVRNYVKYFRNKNVLLQSNDTDVLWLHNSHILALIIKLAFIENNTFEQHI